MARTIAVSDEVYTLLKRSRMPKESFSKVIKRSLKRGGRLSDLAGKGTISRSDWKRAQAAIRQAEEITQEKIGAMA